MNNLMLVEVRRVTMFRDKRVLNVLLNGFGVMMVYAGMMGGAMVMVSLLNFVHFTEWKRNKCPNPYLCTTFILYI